MINRLLNVENLSFSYDSKIVLDNISFEVDKNTINACLCPNKCGKTTLIRLISGIDELKDGNVSINGINLDKDNFSEYQLEVGTVLDDIDNQFICNKVNDELRYPLINLGRKERDIQNKIDTIAPLLKLALILGKDILRLTYYEKVRVLIAASLMHSPKLLLLDDVFRFLNDRDKKELFNILKTLKSKLNLTILFTTSNLIDTKECDKVLVMNNGFIVMDDTFENIVINDNELAKMGIEIPIMIDY